MCIITRLNMSVSIVFLLFILPVYCFNKNDIELISVFAQPLIKQCILVTSFRERISKIPPQIKSLSNNNIFTIYFDFSQLINFLKRNSFPDLKTLIVLKIKNDLDLSTITKQLNSKDFYDDIISKFTWMIILPENKYKITENDFRVPINCEFFIASNKNFEYEIIEVYQIKNTSNMIHSNFGYFNRKDFNFNENYIYQRRNNFHKETLIINLGRKATCSFPIDCLQSELINDFAHLLNFSIKIVTSSDVLTNSSIKTDVESFLEVFHSIEKNKRAMLGPILDTVTHMYIRNLQGNEKNWNAYLQPFENDLWLAILSWILFSGVIIFLMGFLTSTILLLQGYSLIDQGLTPLSSFCSQGHDKYPSNFSSRIAKISAYIASIIIFQAYSASVISYLTVDRTIIPFTDFKSFIQDGTYKLAPFKNDFNILFFKEGKDLAVQKIREKYLIDYDDWPNNHQEAINMICTQEKLSVLNYNYKMLQIPAPCKIIIVSDNLMPLRSAIKLGEAGVQYKKLFFDLLIKFRTSVVLKRFVKRIHGKTDFKIQQEFREIDIDTILSLIAILKLGVFISLIIFLGEIIQYRSKSKENSTKVAKKRFNRFDRCSKINVEL